MSVFCQAGGSIDVSHIWALSCILPTRRSPMKNALCVLYDPPSRGHPALAVVLDKNSNQVLAARAISVGTSGAAFAEMIADMDATGDFVFMLDGNYGSPPDVPFSASRPPRS